MEAFFLSVIALLAFLVIVTTLCTLLRFGANQHPIASYEGVGHLAQRRHHLLGATLALCLSVVFIVTLLLAVVTR
jgi:putative exporter of polyketide antibiotics